MGADQAVDDLPPDAFSDALWCELMPWLAQYSSGTVTELSHLSPASDWWLTESPAVSSTVVAMSQVTRAVAQLVVSDMGAAKLAQVVPGLPKDRPVAALHLSSRAMTTLQRLPAEDLGALGEASVEDLFAVRGTDIGTVLEITKCLVAEVSLRRADRNHGAFPVTPPEDGPRPVEQQLLDDLRQLARWRQVRGELEAPLLGSIGIEERAPEEVQELGLRLSALTGADFAQNGTDLDPFAELAVLAERLDDRQLTVVRDRFVAAAPKTLAELAEQFGVSRERVRQIETLARTQMSEAFRYGTAVGGLLSSMRVEIQPICALDRLVSRHPELEREVPQFGVPLWLVLDRLDDYFEVSDGWAAAPDVTHAREQTRALLEDFASPEGVVDLEAVALGSRMSPEELGSWLSWCGYQILDGRVLTRTRTAADHAAAILAVAGVPLELDALLARMVPSRAEGTVANALSVDERFVRTDRTTWALAGWDVEAYTSIRDQVGRALDAAGGEVPLERLVADLAGRFSVAPASIITYASAGEFEVREGIVRRRTGAAASQKSPSATRRLFQDQFGWRYHLTVNRDHLRGSGFTIPAGVAAVAGCSPGGVVELPSRLGTQSVRWTGPQPGCGTIRRFLEDLALSEGDSVFLRFGTDGRFDVERLVSPENPDNPLSVALSLVGGPPGTSAEKVVEVVAVAVGLPAGTPPRRILRACRQRGDDDLAAELEKVWVRPYHPVTVDPGR